VLLDTHVWIWLVVDEPRRLGPRTRRSLRKAVGRTAPSVSAASALEIAALHTGGRLQFTMPVERWLRESIARAGLRVLDVDADIAIDAGLIPAAALADPLDRLLVATAREHQIPLVTRDRRILDYAAATRALRVVDASA
jgi:PIN domain nuclease of toxin-antitoxin system